MKTGLLGKIEETLSGKNCYQIALLRRDPDLGEIPDHDKTAILYTTKTTFSSEGKISMTVRKGKPVEVQLDE